MAEVIILHDFKLSYKSIVIKIVLYLHKQILGQWSRIESPEITHRCMINYFMTEETNIYNAERTESSIHGVGRTGLSHIIHKNKLKMD